MKLISMTDFVLSQTTPDWLELCEFEENSYKVYNYAKFLKQHLELWMFVPCDEDGNILNEFDCLVNIYMHTKWFEAKQRCLFEGFEICKISQNQKCVVNKKFHLDYNFKQFINIEDLVKYDLQLTKTAINQLGLSDN